MGARFLRKRRFSLTDTVRVGALKRNYVNKAIMKLRLIYFRTCVLTGSVVVTEKCDGNKQSVV